MLKDNKLEEGKETNAHIIDLSISQHPSGQVFQQQIANFNLPVDDLRRQLQFRFDIETQIRTPG